jgi:hypothetical protein
MRSVWMGLALMCVVQQPSTSFANEVFFQSGNSLFETCRGLGSASGACLTYIVGVVDGLSAAGGPIGEAFCLPPGSTQGQIGDVALRYLTAHPEARNIQASALVARSMVEAFPCR